ncbi:MAG: FAD-binding oxidoreductase [Desulfosarcina sp.]
MERVIDSSTLKAVLKDRRWLAPKILELRLDRPAGFTFLPGQFLRIRMDGYQRDYTMVSGPDDQTLDFCIALVDRGRFSTDILTVEIGSALSVSGPHGHFIFQGSVNPVVFVATGTGVAPFVAFLRSGVRDALLLHGADTADQLIYRALLQSGLRSYVPCISRPQGNDDGFHGRVTRYLQEQLKSGIYDFYLCGRRAMIRDATAIIDRQFGDSRLFIETYD